MEFKDLQVIWNEQSNEPQFVVDSDLLYSRLEQDDIKTQRFQAFEEWCYAAMTAVVGVLTISEPILEHKEYHQLPLGAVFLFLSAYFLWKKRQRRKEAPDYDESFLGMIDGSIAHLESYSRWTKWANILFWVCTIISSLVTLFLYYDSKPIWIWIGLVVMLGVTYVAVGKQLQDKALAIENLRSLKRQLKS